MTSVDDATGTSGVLAGRYRLQERIGAGGMGVVWRATDEVLGRTVAVKVLRETLADDRQAAERFRREALTVASLSHPGFADVFDYFEAGGRPAIAMEYVDGETLAERLRRDGAMGLDDAVAIAGEVLDALATAHQAGVVHRDIKPANVLLAADRVKITDLGIASVSGATALTQTGALMATPHYVAPEQLLGEHAGVASDLYSLGAVLYEMLTGIRPFEGETSIAIAMSRLNVAPVPPSRHRTSIPPAVDAVIMRSLALDPADRYRDAASMRAALEAAAADPWSSTMPLSSAEANTTLIERPQAPPAGPKPRSRRRRRRTLAGLLVAVAMMAGVAGLILLPTSAVAAPTLEGLSLDEASEVADDLGLVLHFERAPSVAPVDQVLEQDPAPGIEIPKGETITVTVSDGSLRRVPIVAGRSLDEARAVLERRGLEVGEVRRAPTDGVEPGIVLTQDPHGGTVKAGTPVDLVVTAEPDDEKDKGKGDDGRGNGTRGRDGKNGGDDD